MLFRHATLRAQCNPEWTAEHSARNLLNSVCTKCLPPTVSQNYSRMKMCLRTHHLFKRTNHIPARTSHIAAPGASPREKKNICPDSQFRFIQRKSYKDKSTLKGSRFKTNLFIKIFIFCFSSWFKETEKEKTTQGEEHYTHFYHTLPQQLAPKAPSNVGHITLPKE